MTDFLRCLALIILTLISHVSSSAALQVEIYPHELYPGDPFVIKVRGMNPQKTEARIAGKVIPFSSCGNDCLMGVSLIDPDAQPGEIIVSTNAGMEKIVTALTVKKAEYPEQHLALPERQVDLSPEDIARVTAEADRLKAIWKASSDRLFEGRFVMPLPNAVVTAYGARRILNEKTVSIHGGVDIRGSKGEEIRASNRGRVVLVDNLFSGGNTVIRDHGLGIYTVYMHLDIALAHPGDLVSKGEVIGLVGSSGRATGPHLHFGAKIMSTNANPISLTRLPLE